MAACLWKIFLLVSSVALVYSSTVCHDAECKDVPNEPWTSGLAVVTRLLDYYNTGNLAGVFSLVDDEVEWIVPSPVILPFSGAWRGKIELGRFFNAVVATMEMTEPLSFTCILQNELEGRFVVSGKTKNVKAKTSNKNIDLVEVLYSFELNRSSFLVDRFVGHYKNPAKIHRAVLTAQQTTVINFNTAIRSGEPETALEFLHRDVIINVLNAEFLPLGFKLEYHGVDDASRWLQHSQRNFVAHIIDWNVNLLQNHHSISPNFVVTHSKVNFEFAEGSVLYGRESEVRYVLTIFELRDAKIVHIQEMLNDIGFQ